MKKRFKKIYVEITNNCNLNCSFCSKDKREKREMTPLEFEKVLLKIKDYTSYIYLHVKGEPLLHNNLDEILSLCDRYNLMVNITTNGTLLDKKFTILNKHNSIRQINVSLHCEKSGKNYFEQVFSVCKKLSSKMFISYRIWLLDNFSFDKKSVDIVEKIISYYKLSPSVVEKIYNDKSIKIDNNTYVDKDNIFVWPCEKNNYDIDGFCYALKTHIGILSNGDIIPCCLDSSGVIKLGNIFEDDLNQILDSDLYLSLLNGFRNNKSIHPLCKNCNFRNRFNSK